MLAWTIIFLIGALLSGLVAFTDTLPSATGIARVIFFVFLVMFAVALMTANARQA